MALTKLSKVLVEQRETTGKKNGDNLPLIGVNNKDGLIRSQQLRIADLSRYKLIKYNWLAYNPMRINVGSIGIADNIEKVGLISPDYVVFSCNDLILPEFFLFFIKSEIGLTEIKKNTGGSVRERLYFRNLANIEMELPNIEEQRKHLSSLSRIRDSISLAYKLVDCLNDMQDLISRKAFIRK